MKASQTTKSIKNKKILLGLIHFLLVFGPLLFFFPYAFIVGTTVTKLTMSITIVISIILGAVSALSEAKHNGYHKSIMWLLIVAVMLVLTELTQIRTFIFIMAAASFIDELIISPLYQRKKIQLITNKELDKRI